MRLPTQILLLGAILTNSVRANETPPAASAAATQPAPDAPVQLEPVVVTADLWRTPLERIAASVSVYDGAKFASDGVRHFGDLADQIPNLTWTGGTSRPRYFQIRGIGENSQYEGETPDSSVVFKVDDLDFTGLGTVGGAFDVRQVEVLRGPQAGAFGANAAGGLIQLVTNAPTPYWTGKVEGTAGTDQLFEGGLAFGGPLLKKNPEKLTFRVALQQHNSDGFRTNALLGDSNARDEFSSRLRVTWKPCSAWTWDGAAFFANVNNGFDDFSLNNSPRRTFSDQAGRDEQVSLAGSLRGVYSGWQDVRLTTVTTAATTDSVYSYDGDWTAWTDTPPINLTDGFSGFTDLRRQRDTWSQELRFDSVDTVDALGFIDRWTTGLYAAHTGENGRFISDYAEPGFSSRGIMDTKYRSTNAAAFGQAGHDLGAADRLTLGLRVERVDIAGSARNDANLSNSGPSLDSVSPDFDDTLFGGKLTYEHDLKPGQLLFASVARGYKAGGVATDSRISAADAQTYATEHLWNYEAGLRSQWADTGLGNQLTVFYTAREDAQVRDSAGYGGSWRFFTDNADGAAIYGLEDALTYAFADGWSADASLALMQSDIEKFTLTNGNTGGGRSLANVPAYGYTLGLRYAKPRGVFGRVELVARGDYYDSNTNNEKRSAYEVVNASLGYAWDGWRVSFWARNLFDEGYEKRVFYFANTPAAWNAGISSRYESRADPRQVGVTASYEF
jgi:outer membrane receptor protein involved in Fe transport